MNIEISQIKEKDRIIIKLSLAVLLSAILILPFLYSPDSLPNPGCLFKVWTGYSCPGCGITRSFFATGLGNPGFAFQYHIMGPLLYVFLVILILKFSFEVVTRRELLFRIHPLLRRMIFFILLGSWVLFYINRLLGEIWH